MQTQQAQNIFQSPKSLGDFQETNPRELKSKLAAPCSFYMVFF